MDDTNPENQPVTPSNPASPSPGASPQPTETTPSKSAPSEPAISPPNPGQVISSAPEAASGGPKSPSQPLFSPDKPSGQVISSQGGGGKRWGKRLLVLLLAIVLVAGGWLLYDHFLKKKPASVTTQSKNIPLLKIGVSQADFGNLYPDMTPSNYALMVNSQMFEGLVRYENTNKIVPDLASTWTNPDDKTWLFTIRPNVKFHDGHTLAAKDVKYSLDAIMANNPDLTDLFASTIASVELVGSNQVKITTKEPDPVLLNRLSILYIIDANAPKGSEPSQAGTGPYMIKPGTKPTGTDLKMVAFNDYHGGQPTTQALDFGATEDAASLVKAFKDHKFNIAGPVPVQDAKKVTGAHEFISSEPNVDYIGFNTVKAGPLQNKLVREAIRYAVDAKAIGEANGNQATPISQMIPHSIPGYNPSITPYKQNIEKAKQLLAQAGYPNGLTVKLSVPSDSQTAPVIVKDLKQAGITATLDPHSDFDEFIDYFNSGKADMFVINYSSDTLDGLDIDSTVFNTENYNNPKFTALLGQISTTTDPAKRLKLLQEAGTIINDDVAVVPLYSENDIWLMDKNYNIQQDMPSSYISVYFNKVRLN